MNNSSNNSKRVILQTNNQNDKEKEEDFIIIDPTYPYMENKNQNEKENENLEKKFENSPYILELEVINSSFLSNGTKIKIDQFGLLEGSLRNAKDNITYFGYMENSDDKNIDKDNSLDYLLPFKHCEKLGRFFKIQYIPKLNEYIIKDLGNGLGTFIKIQDLIYIRDSQMINIGDSYLIFYFIDSNEEININKSNENKNMNKKEDLNNIYGINHKLKIKLYDSKNNDEMKEFIFENNSEKTIHIGRKNHGNEIELNDHLSSKVNCIIQYNRENGWIVKDGNEIILKDGDIKRNYSRNGTWFLAIENIKIVDKLIFKSNFNIFKCNLIKS